MSLKNKPVENPHLSFQFLKNTGLSGGIFVLVVMSICFVWQISIHWIWPIILGVVYFLNVTIFYFFYQIIRTFKKNKKKQQTRVLIYGAGEAGLQLSAALNDTLEMNAVGFIDDNSLKHGAVFCGLQVYSPREAKDLVLANSIDRIIIAMPSIPLDKREDIVSNFRHLECEIDVMPANIDLYRMDGILNSLFSISQKYDLGMDPVGKKEDSRRLKYAGKTILVTGAGGSIGKEICRQLLHFSPKVLILFEQSELALYEVNLDLNNTASERRILLVPMLGDICDGSMLKNIFDRQDIDIVFHAAAYKHVPLLETNEISGIRNNVIGTHTLASKAYDASVEKFVLISSDKAVRPTSLMGASKRVAELIIQDFSRRSKKTKFSMVRFGNVLGSSGSVVPLFKKQILAGGPVTLTHQDVSRYFMAIPDAAGLVIEAGSFASGGEVFVLNMGEPIKITQLARNLIEKNDLTVRDAANPDGDIELKYIGLRPGEKLFEELLIDPLTLDMSHPNIFIATEAQLKHSDLSKLLKAIVKAINENDPLALRKLVFKAVQ